LFFDDFLDVAMLGVLAALEQRIAGTALEQALIDDPGAGLDTNLQSQLQLAGGNNPPRSLQIRPKHGGILSQAP
jgi:hypothetical protein